MTKKSILKHIDFLIVDIISLSISFILAYFIYFKDVNSLFDKVEYRTLYLDILLLSFCYLAFTSPYSGILKRNLLKELKSILTYVISTFCLLSLFLFSTKQGSTYSRITIYLVFIIYVFINFILKNIWKKIIIVFNENEIENQRSIKVIVVTTSKELKSVIKNIKSKSLSPYIVDSICVIDKSLKGKEIDGYKIKSNSKDLLSYICHTWVDEIFVATDPNNLSKELFKGFASAGITTNVMIEPIEEFGDRKMTVNKMFNYTVATTSIAPRSNNQMIAKRLLDIVGGIVGSIITLLLTIIIGPIIYIKSPGPIFYKQVRIGQNGRKFNMYKFRSMVLNADDLKESLQKKNRIKDGMMFKIENDPRIIPGIGNFIRNTSIDEFPQFINVLKGDMSLVGTRPPTVDEWDKYKLEHRIRMAIKPGITGLWQTNGRSKITDFNKVIEYDTKYINEWSLSLDIEILIKTILVLFSKRDKEEAM